MNREIGELEILEATIADGLADLFQSVSDVSLSSSPLVDIQPPRSVCEAAGRAAAAVFIGFERGYRMESVEERAMSEQKLWELVAPYIASEDAEYNEETAEDMASNVLPRLWSAYATQAAEIERLRRWKVEAIELEPRLQHLVLGEDYTEDDVRAGRRLAAALEGESGE